MKREFIYRLKRDDAEIMLESTIIIIIVLFMLTAMISVGFLFYQQSLISSLEKCKERLKISSFGIAENDPSVAVGITVDNVGRLHTEVTVTLECSILFDGALKYFHIIDSTPEFSATARGECLDVTAYASQVHFMNYITEKMGDPNILNIVKQTVRIIRNGASIVEVFTGE